MWLPWETDPLPLLYAKLVANGDPLKDSFNSPMQHTWTLTDGLNSSISFRMHFPTLGLSCFPDIPPIKYASGSCIPCYKFLGVAYPLDLEFSLIRDVVMQTGKFCRLPIYAKVLVLSCTSYMYMRIMAISNTIKTEFTLEECKILKVQDNLPWHVSMDKGYVLPLYVIYSLVLIISNKFRTIYHLQVA